MSEQQKPKLAVPEVKAKPRTMDPEIQAMAKCDRIIAELSKEGAARVTSWFTSRYGIMKFMVNQDTVEAPSHEGR